MLLARAIPLKPKAPGLREAASLLAALGIMAALYFGGQARMEQINQASQKAPHLNVSVVQGNIPIPHMWKKDKRLPIINQHVELTQKLAEKVKERPWLVVWSESAAPFFFVSDKVPSQPVFDLARRQKAMIVLGTLGSARLENGKLGMTNRSALVDQNGNYAGFYDKVHLVPFGEYVPWEYIFFWVRALAVMSDNFTPGAQGATIPAGPASLGPLICYESIFPELARAQRRRGADLIINQTNDAWFGRTDASWQHLSHLVMRCIENRMSCARSANSGVSCFVHPDGRVSQPTGLFNIDARSERLPLLKMQTLCTAYGQWVGPASLLICALLLLVGRLRGRNGVSKAP